MSALRGPERFQRSLSVVQRQFSWREPVRPFVSSTFKDFQTERDLLVKCVFPKLEQLSRLRGTYFAPVDLRWGITSKQASSGDVVRLCLDFVARSAPFFIGLLGERYGSHIAPNSDANELTTVRCSGESDSDWLRQSFAVAQRSGYDWIGEKKYENSSITELEIELAAFREKFTYARFYFRSKAAAACEESTKCETTFAADALQRLKDRIVQADLPVGMFVTPSELADMVARDWRDIIDEMYPPLFDMLPLTNGDDVAVESEGAQHRLFVEWAAHEAFAETRRRAFVATPQVVDVVRRIHDFVGQSDVDDPDGSLETRSGLDSSPTVVDRSRIAVVVGERGCGKSALLANWCREFHDDEPEVRVVSHYVGSSSSSATPLGFMLHCIDELRASFLDTPSASKGEKREDRSDVMLVRAAFKAALSLGHCVVVLDGMDEMTLESVHDAHEVLEWLPFPLPAQCHIIISTSPGHITLEALKSRPDVSIFRLALLDATSARRLLVERHLAVHCKQLDADQMERVVQSPLAERPVFLASLANELRIFGIHEHVNDRLDYYLAVKSIAELWGRILHRWSQDYGWEVEGCASAEEQDSKQLKGWVADALRLIAVSRQGLKEDEMLAALHCLGYNLTTLDWASFRSAAGDALFERQGGLLNFLHLPLRNAVFGHLLNVENVEERSVAELNRYNLDVSHKSAWHCRLADILESWPLSRRRTEELPWQRDVGGDMDGLLRCVSEPAIFLELADRNDHRSHGMLTLDLWNYWHRLTAAGHDQADVYEAMLSAERKKLSASSNIEEHARFALLAGAVGQLHASNGRFHLSQKALSNALAKAELVVKHGDRGNIADSASNRSDCDKSAAQSHLELLSTIQEQLANLCLYQLKVGDAELWYRAALDNTPGSNSSDKGKVLDSAATERRGRLLDALGFLKAKDSSSNSAACQREAVRLLTEANECMVAAGSTPGQADVAFHLAVVRLRQGHFHEAEDGLRKALRARKGWYGVDHPMVAEVMNELAGLLSNPRLHPPAPALEEAEKLYRRALEVRRRTLGNDHLLVATTLFHLGKLLKKSRERVRLEEAKSLLLMSLEVRTKHLGPEHGITRAVRRCLHELLSELESKSPSHGHNVGSQNTVSSAGRGNSFNLPERSADGRQERNLRYDRDDGRSGTSSKATSAHRVVRNLDSRDRSYMHRHEADQSEQEFCHSDRHGFSVKRTSPGKGQKPEENAGDDDGEWQTVKRRRDIQQERRQSSSSGRSRSRGYRPK